MVAVEFLATALGWEFFPSDTVAFALDASWDVALARAFVGVAISLCALLLCGDCMSPLRDVSRHITPLKIVYHVLSRLTTG